MLARKPVLPVQSIAISRYAIGSLVRTLSSLSRMGRTVRAMASSCYCTLPETSRSSESRVAVRKCSVGCGAFTALTLNCAKMAGRRLSRIWAHLQRQPTGVRFRHRR
jgi:hypothetical protein